MSENKHLQDQKSIFREWLEKLQQESWQLELLISGFALFGIYSARSLITDLEFFRSNQVFGDVGVIIGGLIFILKTGWLIFFINLIIHVILRGLWIGAIGLRYVSNEIEYKELGYSERFTQFLRNDVGSYDDFIERLERICSVLFAYTFLLFLLFASLMIFLLQFLGIMLIGIKLDPENGRLLAFISLFGTFYFLIGMIVFFDLITLGGFKKIKEKHISALYYYLYRYFSFVTLSFLYRPLLYNFIDNAYTKKLFFLSIPYIFFVIGGYTMFENNSNPYLPPKDALLESGNVIDDYYYDDLRNLMLQEFPNEERKINKSKLNWVSLESFAISEKVSSVFFKIDGSLNKLLALDTTLIPYKKSGVSFKWFNKNHIDDNQIKTIEKQKTTDLMSLYEKKRELSKAIRKGKNDSDMKTLEDISLQIEQKSIYWDAQLTKYKTQKIEKLMDKYKNQFELYIDSTAISLQNCYYYNHPHFGEQGIKCFYYLDSISAGLHQLKVIRNYFTKSETIVKDSLILPILHK